jgi:hypothetical protein
MARSDEREERLREVDNDLGVLLGTGSGRRDVELAVELELDGADRDTDVTGSVEGSALSCEDSVIERDVEIDKAAAVFERERPVRRGEKVDGFETGPLPPVSCALFGLDITVFISTFSGIPET